MHVVLETGRLTLRRFTEADVDNLFELNSDPELRYINSGKPTPREEIRDNIIPFRLGFCEKFDGLGTWAAQARSTGEFPGWANGDARAGTVGGATSSRPSGPQLGRCGRSRLESDVIKTMI
jgi:RimJ/RimL family protein N-acetyltransferase